MNTGRKTKLTEKLQETICKYIADGNYLVTACAAVGISRTSYFEWIQRGEEELNNGGGQFANFVNAVKKAEAEAEAKLLDVVRNEAVNSKNWLAAMTFLERRHPERWARKDRNATPSEYQDNRQINIIVSNEKAKELTDGIGQAFTPALEQGNNEPND